MLTNRFWSLASLAALALSTSLAGCGGDAGASDAVVSEDSYTERRPLQVVAAREWGRCWFDVVGDSAQLSCTSTPSTDDPLAAKVTVSAMGNTPGVTTATRGLDGTSDGAFVVGSLPRSAFPASIMFQATLSSEARAMLGLAEDAPITLQTFVAAPEKVSSAAPAVFVQPFDLWPVALIDLRQDRSSPFSLEAKYGREIAPLTVGSFQSSTLTFEPKRIGGDSPGVLRYFAAPSSGAISAKLTSTSTAAEIARPGYYAVTTEGLRPAQPEEITAYHSAEAEQGGTAASTASGPDADPSCGGAGQAKCAGGCDTSTRYESNGFTEGCVACGDDGQTYCLGGPTGLTHVCKPGLTYDEFADTCRN